MKRLFHSLIGSGDRIRRDWPYPYRAAVSLSNDVDYCQFDFFDTFMRYCNGRSETPFGLGLGLEVTSSVFGFSLPDRQFSYFAGLSCDSPLSGSASRIAEYIRAGWIDSNHAFGDFDGTGGFSRAHAIRFLEEMARVGGDIRVFINHGDDRNVQCIGPGTKHHKGDDPKSLEYHTDLMISSGRHYLTTSVHTIGHVDEEPLPIGKDASIKQWLLASLRQRSRKHADKLLVPYRLQDGSEVLAFHRLRATGYNAPNLGSLGYQIDRIDFDVLCEKAGCVIIYQHWGVLHRSGRRCVSATVEEVSARPELTIGLRRLALESDMGRVWVAGLQRLLDYAFMVENSCVDTTATPGVIEVECSLPVCHPERFFQGLTIYVDPSITTRVLFRNRELYVNYNGPDQTGRYSVSVPLIAKEYIW